MSCLSETGFSQSLPIDSGLRAEYQEYERKMQQELDNCMG